MVEDLIRLCGAIHDLDMNSTFMNQKLIKKYKENTLEFLKQYLLNEYGDCEDLQSDLILYGEMLDISPKWWCKT